VFEGRFYGEQIMAEESSRAEVLAASGPGSWSLERYLGQLKDFLLPEGQFDAEGSWEHRYNVYPIYTKWSVWSEKHEGECVIKRKELPGGGDFELEVSSEVTFIDFGYGNHPTKSQLTTAKIRCANDVLGTPKSWELESAALGEGKNRFSLSEVRERGVFERGKVVLGSAGVRRRRIKVVGDLTSNWSLFDAVQRMYKAKETPNREFSMLEDLRLLRVGQRLVYDGPAEFDLGGKRVRLYGYHQIGEGILPIHYWVDETGRLLFALGGVRIYLWQSE